jgi:preprotein translocase subunit SecD
LFRFGEFRPFFFSSVESTIDGSTLSFRFKRGAPAQSTVTYLYQTPGRVRATLVEGFGILFTDKDIEQAHLAFENERHVIRLRLTPAAGNRVLALTTRNVGKTARLTLDGRVLLEAVITGVLRDTFQVTSPEEDTEKAKALVVVLQSGALPAVVSLDNDARGT